MTPSGMPEIIQISDADLIACTSPSDLSHHLFDIYRGIGLEANLLSSISRTSPALDTSNHRNLTIFIGLLNRCSKLMLSNIKLSHERRSGETAAILDRCIFESALTISWLCGSGKPDSFERYVANGLKSDLELEKSIQSKIQERGSSLPIEDRMLASIEHHVVESGMTRTEIESTKKLPDIASMLDALKYDRLVYVVAQRIGSHHTHGTWSSLLYGYLRKENSTYVPRGDDVEMHPNQFLATSIFMLKAITTFIETMIKEEDSRNHLLERIEAHETSLQKVQARLADLSGWNEKS